MIKKFLLGLFSLALVFPALVFAKPMVSSPTPTSTPEPTDSYTLFWPIVAGTVRGQTLYSLKQVKEAIREFLIFSDYRKADYNITLSVKRVVEAEKLYLQLKDYKNGAATLQDAQAKREKALLLMRKAEGEGKAIKDLKVTLAAIAEKQKRVELGMESQVPEGERGPISRDLTRVDKLLSQLQ